MSKAVKWKYNDIYANHLRREKLINMLLSEIIFLKKQVKKYNLKNERIQITKALMKLEYLLNILKNSDSELTDSDFDKVIEFIYETFKCIVEDL